MASLTALHTLWLPERFHLLYGLLNGSTCFMASWAVLHTLCLPERFSLHGRRPGGFRLRCLPPAWFLPHQAPTAPPISLIPKALHFCLSLSLPASRNSPWDLLLCFCPAPGPSTWDLLPCPSPAHGPYTSSYWLDSKLQATCPWYLQIPMQWYCYITTVAFYYENMK